MPDISIQKTVKKYHYGVDGTGRDMYIHFDNGGNYRGCRLEGLGKFEVGTFIKKVVHKRKAYTNVEGKPIHYFGDGTGRDFYVISNEGGLTEKGKKKQQNFIATLRRPVKMKQARRKGVLLKRQSQKWKGWEECGWRSQRSLVRKLSQPKRCEDPYKNMKNSFRSSIGLKN